MEIPDLVRAIFALVFTLGLIGLAAVGLRKFGPEALARFTGSPKADRRLAVVETLVLDPSRRLILVSLDGEERLLLLGEGQMLSPSSAKPARKPKTVA